MKNRKMIAGVFQGEGKFEVVEKPIPKLDSHNNVLLKNKVASICGSDLKILKVPQEHYAKLGVTLGHEYVGEVDSIGENVKYTKTGDRVLMNPNYYCGACYYCENNLPEFCEEIGKVNPIGVFQDGGFAEYSVVPEKSLYKLPETLDFVKGSFAESLACAVNGYWKLDFKLGQSVVIFGSGPIGCYFIQLLKKSGAERIFVIELSEFRKSFAKKIGADYSFNAAKKDIDSIISEIYKIEPYGVDAVIDAGYATSFADAIKLTKKGGKILLFGVNEVSTQVVKQHDITTHGLTIIGNWTTSFIAPFKSSLQLINDGSIDVESMITDKIGLQDIKKGIKLLNEGRAIKVIIDC